MSPAGVLDIAYEVSGSDTGAPVVPLHGFPAISLEGADDGVDPPGASDKDARHFGARYRRQVVPGVGHNIPREWPDGFADAVLRVASGAV